MIQLLEMVMIKMHMKLNNCHVRQSSNNESNCD